MKTYERMLFVSISEASPRSGASWSIGMSVRTACLSAFDELREARDQSPRIGLLAERQQDALLALAPRSKSVEVCRDRA